MADTQLNPKTIYEELITTRSDYETRAEELAKLTIPALFPKDGASSSDAMTDGYASRYSAIAINSLAAQMELTLLPASGSSFRFEPDAQALAEFTQGDADSLAQTSALLSEASDRVNKEIENQSIRPQFGAFLQTMVAVSPVVVEKVKDNGIKWYGLRSFAVKLNDVGDPLQIVTKQTLDRNNLPDGIEADEGEKEVELYTLCHWEDDKWTVTQSKGDEIVGGESTFKKDNLPYVYLGWTRQQGDTYHRPFAEQFQGLLEDYAAMNKVLVEGSIVASKVLLMVNPLGSTKKKDVSDSKNGAVVDGRADDVTALQLGKNYDFQIPMELRNELKQQIDRAFLSRQGTQRQAERVTAEEINRDAQELEKNLAGIYSIMSKKFSKWLILQIMGELKITFETIDVNVITGLDALGKNIESQKLDAFMQRMAALELRTWIKEPELITRYAAYDGINVTNLIKTPKEVQTERAEAQKQAAMNEMGMSAAKSAGETAGSSVASQGGQPQQ